ncbi:chymotrypsin-like protease CTRL-1 [Diachasmimorpha longicaudata]|uniref:chymotrypsin-like protease CTRL-1 n=1 Tax=Diachasmimorpha longicaudata TaxID=58733 RepID=UPI0030B89744
MKSLRYFERMIWVLLGCVTAVTSDYVNFYVNDNRAGNILACPQDKLCTPIDYCRDILSLVNEGTLPVHRFRQAVCGYIGTNPKVCCNNPGDVKNNPYDPRALDPKMECGKTLVRSNVVTIGSFPFLARIGFINLSDGTLAYPCTGTIINERTILTTATCALATSEEYKLHSVILGDFDTSENPDCNPLFCAHCASSYNISFVIKHPNFEAGKFERNIALIRLDESIMYTLTIQPICYSDRTYITVGSQSTLIGWGSVSNDKEQSPPVQQSLSMQLLRLQDCAEFVNQGMSVEMCAIGRQNPCPGFSGSPLIKRDGNGYTVIGILSFGATCEVNKNSPSVFINVQKYTRWIAENS